MIRTPSLPRRRRIDRVRATRPTAQRMLRDIAFVLAVTRRVREEMRTERARG